MKIRVGVVGLGPAWEKRYRPALRALSDRFEVRAVCEPVAQRAAQAAREFNATRVDGYRALAAREDVDAVLALSRQWFGSLPITAACDAGKAVYCTDGLELHMDQAVKLKEHIQNSGVAFMAEFPRRHAPATLRLKELIATRLGLPKMLFCHLRVPADKPNQAHQDEYPNDSALLNLVELIDWCRYVVDREPTSVSGLEHTSTIGGLTGDYHMLSLEFQRSVDSGEAAIAQISVGRYVPASWPEAVSFRPPAHLQVTCEGGVAFVDLPSSLIWFDKAGRHMESLESERPVGETLLSQFHRSVTSLVRKTNNLEDTYQALAIALAAQRSHEEGRRIDLDFS